MDAKCSFSELRKSRCGDFRGSPFVVGRLLECKDDITGHKQSCHLSKLVGSVEEHDLHNTYESWKIRFANTPAGKHVDLPNWRLLKTCQYPLHSGARKKQRCGQSADVKKYSNYFWVTIPIGSGKRVSFNNYKMSTPPQEAILPCFGALNVADFLFCSWDWMGVYWFWNAVWS